MSNVLFLSDTHLDHKNIIKFRTQFKSSEEHDAVIKENYHQIVRPKDTVWFLGDVAFSKAALDDLATWPGIKHIVLGNHDIEYSKHDFTFQDIFKVFNNNIYGVLRKYNYWLSHVPFHETELRGRYNVHGHLHSHVIDDPRYLNICMEHINYTPISLEDIRKTFKDRERLNEQ